MCGIAGVLDWRTNVSDKLEPMLDAIIHRGPDDQGVFNDGPISMGMRRLSIIDLHGGQQPIFNEDGSVVVVFNGEIFNYVELREELEAKGHRFSTSSDTEVLVHLYEEEGTGFLPRLNGMFGFAIWDLRKQQLFIARDRLGIKPMYIAHTPSGLVFGSELKSLLKSGLVEAKIDPRAIFDYLVHFYIPGARSPFLGINKLLPGHCVVASAEHCETRRWWNLGDYAASQSVSREEATAKIRELFEDSVKLRMRSDVPVGAFLSGGLDSSLVTAVATQQTDLPFSTFSVGFTNSEFDELPYAQAVSEHCATEHHEIRVSPSDAMEHFPNLIWHMDEPCGDAAILPTYLVSKLAASKVKVALSGIGADEFFGGYHRYHKSLGKLNQLGVLPPAVLKIIKPLVASVKDDWGYRMDRLISPPAPWINHLEQTHRYDADRLSKLFPEAESEIGDYTRSLFEQYPGHDYVNQRMYVDAHSYLPDQILAVTDRMSMAVSLEARAPFLDYRLVEYATSLPGSWKVDGVEWKVILKDALGDLVPERTIKRPKWGFAPPIKSWMNSSQLDAFLSLLRTSRLAQDGYLVTEELEALVADPAQLNLYGEWIWAIAVLELWYRIYSPDGDFSRPDMSLVDFINRDTASADTQQESAVA